MFDNDPTLEPYGLSSKSAECPNSSSDGGRSVRRARVLARTPKRCRWAVRIAHYVRAPRRKIGDTPLGKLRASRMALVALTLSASGCSRETTKTPPGVRSDILTDTTGVAASLAKTRVREAFA